MYLFKGKFSSTKTEKHVTISYNERKEKELKDQKETLHKNDIIKEEKEPEMEKVKAKQGKIGTNYTLTP